MFHVAYTTGPEIVYIATVNPAPDTRSLPSLERIGKHVAEVDLRSAERGHGLKLVDELSQTWSQANVEGRNGGAN